MVVGSVTGLAAYLLIELLEVFQHFATFLRDSYGTWGSIGLLLVAGLLTGMLIHFFASEAKGHGVPEVMEAIALKRGRIRPRVAAAKIIASTLTIGSGGSAGREGPIVQVGAALGSTFGQWVRLSDEQRSMLVASGAAAGIAATFNAPIAGCLFALEVILGRFNNRYLGIVVISAVSASVVSHALLGDAPAFQVPLYSLNSPLELPLYALVGLLCAVGAIVFIRVLYSAESFFDSWPVPLPIRTSIGLGLTGLVGVFAPQALGPGLEFIGESIAEDMHLSINLMIGLLFFKLVATTFTLGTGNSGGVFAPGLFMGAMVGGIIGQIGTSLWPSVVIAPGAFALVGMAALFAGMARAPMAAIVIVLEMSNDYRLILPLMLSVIIATLLADLINPETIYTRKLSRRGINLQRGQDIDLLQAVRVEEVMTQDYMQVRPDTRLIDLIVKFNRSHHHGFPIVDDNGQLQGIVTLTDLERAQARGLPYDTTAIDFGTSKGLVTVYPDDPVNLALERINIYRIGRLPVVAREVEGQYLGMVRRADILHAYEISLARKSMEHHRQERLKLRNVERNEFLELEVEPDAPMVGRSLAEFPHSQDCILVKIQRGGRSIIAKGSTEIQPGDIITAYARQEKHDTVCGQFAPSGWGVREVETLPKDGHHG